MLKRSQPFLRRLANFTAAFGGLLVVSNRCIAVTATFTELAESVGSDLGR